MKVRAKQTAKNAYNQVLFLAGKTYDVVRTDMRHTYVLNELHTETPVDSRQFDRAFVIERSAT